MPLFRSALVAFLVAGFSAGCAVGPDYRRPDAPLPARFVHQPAGDAATGIADADLQAWWTGFNDPLLSRFVELALTRNLDLAQVAARVRQARAGLGAAEAALLPVGGVNAQTARVYQSVETPLGRVLDSTPGFDRHGRAWEVDAGASWELDLFGGLRREREAAVAEYQASEAGAAAARIAVAAQTADLYLVIRELQSRLDVARRQVRTREDLLSAIGRLHAEGLAAELQLSQAEGALAEARASLPLLEAALETAMNALDVMLGTPPGTHRAELAGDAGIPSAPALVGTGSPAELLRRRPDLIAAERRLAASNARIGAAVAEYYPKLSLSGLVGSATSVSAANLFTSGASQASGVLGLRWRLFDFARIDAQIELAQGRTAEHLAAYRLTALHAAEDVENAFSALAWQQARTTQLARAVDALARARQASFLAYESGTVSVIEVLRADEGLLRTTDEQVRARAASARAAVAAFRALGGGWQAPAAQVIAAR